MCKKKDKIEIDDSKLTTKQKEESGLKINKGLLIFCLVILVLIIIFSIVVANINTKK